MLKSQPIFIWSLANEPSIISPATIRPISAECKHSLNQIRKSFNSKLRSKNQIRLTRTKFDLRQVKVSRQTSGRIPKSSMDFAFRSAIVSLTLWDFHLLSKCTLAEIAWGTKDFQRATVRIPAGCCQRTKDWQASEDNCQASQSIW